MTVGVSGSVIDIMLQNNSLNGGKAIANKDKDGKHSVVAIGPNGDVASLHQSTDNVLKKAAVELNMLILSLGACAVIVVIILTLPVDPILVEGVLHMSMANGCQLGKLVLASPLLVLGLVDKMLNGGNGSGIAVQGIAKELIAFSGKIGVIASGSVSTASVSGVGVTAACLAKVGCCRVDVCCDLRCCSG